MDIHNKTRYPETQGGANYGCVAQLTHKDNSKKKGFLPVLLRNCVEIGETRPRHTDEQPQSRAAPLTHHILCWKHSVLSCWPLVDIAMCQALYAELGAQGSYQHWRQLLYSFHE